MSEPPIPAGPTAETATCPSCGAVYDAAGVDFCTCLADHRTPVCPACGACLCKLPPERQKAFWASAPETLHRRRFLDRHREMPDCEHPDGFEELPLALVVEDEPVTRKLACAMLARLGFKPLGASRGDEGLDLAARQKPVLLLTDALLPKMDGRELCKRLKESPATRDIKVIIMSGLYTKGQSRIDALTQFKADAFLKKPISLQDLAGAVAALFPGMAGSSGD